MHNCPRFESYPLDRHVCKFRLGSSSYNDQQVHSQIEIQLVILFQMTFSTTLLDYNQASQNTILDYEVVAEELDILDRQLLYGKMGNYSLAGFQFNLKASDYW